MVTRKSQKIAQDILERINQYATEKVLLGVLSKELDELRARAVNGDTSVSPRVDEICSIIDEKKRWIDTNLPIIAPYIKRIA